MRAAFFDMDRTLLRIDSGITWMKFLHRRGELSSFGMARALFWSVLYKLAVLDMETLANRLVQQMEGDVEEEIIAKCRIWHKEYVQHEVAPLAVESLNAHRDDGDMVVMLTGSTQYAALQVARELDIEHTLCSRIEVDDGRFTGRLEALCFGVHKVTMAESFAEKHGIDLAQSVFYSDSYNDLPMLERVGTPVAVNPDARLLRHARRKQWRIEKWA